MKLASDAGALVDDSQPLPIGALGCEPVRLLPERYGRDSPRAQDLPGRPGRANDRDEEHERPGV